MAHKNYNWVGEFSLQNPTTGESVTFSNSLTYNGIDLLSNAFAGIKSSRITHVYIRYGSDVPETPDIAAATAALFRAGAPDSGTLYIPIGCPPTLTTTQTGMFLANKSIYEYTIPSAVIGNSPSVWRSAPYEADTRFFAIGLVAAQQMDNRNLDIMVAAGRFPETPVLSINTGEVRPGNYKLTLA